MKEIPKATLLKELRSLRNKINKLEKNEAKRKRINEQFSESVQLLRRLYKIANVGIFVLDFYRNRIVEGNPRGAKMLGFGLQEMSGLPIEQIYPKEIQQLLNWWDSLLCKGGVRNGELTCRTRKGKFMPVEITATLLDRNDRQFMLTIVRDITDRKQSEKILIERQTRLELLNSIAMSLTSNMSVDEVISRVVDKISTYFKHFRILFCRINEQAQSEVISSKQPKTMQNINNLIIDLNRVPQFLDSLKKDKIFISDNICHDIRLKPVCKELVENKTAAVMDVPVQYSDRLVGLLGFASPKPRKWSEHEITTLTEVADYLSIAIKDVEAQTKQKRAEKALHQSEKRYQTLAEVLPVGIFHTDGDGRPTYVNQRYCKILGTSVQHGLTKDWTKNLHRDDREMVVREWQKALQNQTSFELEFRLKPVCNKPVWVYVLSVPEQDKTDKVIGYFGIVADISERRRVAAALQESEEKYRMLVQNSNEAIFIIQGSRIRFFNARAVELTGYPENELNDIKYHKLIHSKDQNILSEQLKTSVYDKKSSVPNCLRLVDKKGMTKWVELNSLLIKWKNETGYLWFMNDVTEQKRLQEELARVQRLETAGRVAGQIAHDFNNLLSPLAAYPFLIREELSDGHPAVEMLNEMEDSAKKIAEINQQLLALGRRGHYAMEPIALNDLVHKILISENLLTDITVKEKLDPGLFLIKGGAAQLTRAIINLFKNAIETMQGKGILTIKTENTYLDRPLHGYQTIARGEYVKLSISDTGMGIKSEILDKIFDPFFTTKRMDRRRGSGLGLSVVHGIMEDHKGYIQVDSKVRKGTTFSLYFPVNRDTEREEPVSEIKLFDGNERILVVDDDPIQRRVASQVLRRLGYRVQAVSSGEKAVAHLHKRRYDLLIMDMVMEGIDGVEAYKRILEFEPEQKAIILSGYAMSNRVQTAIKLGAGAFVSKPVSQKILANAVRKELDRKVKKNKIASTVI